MQTVCWLDTPLGARRGRRRVCPRGRLSSDTWYSEAPVTVWKCGYKRKLAVKARQVSPRGLLSSDTWYSEEPLCTVWTPVRIQKKTLCRLVEILTMAQVDFMKVTSQIGWYIKRSYIIEPWLHPTMTQEETLCRLHPTMIQEETLCRLHPTMIQEETLCRLHPTMVHRGDIM